MAELPTTQRQWLLSGRGSFDKLSFSNEAPLPAVGEKDVLIRVKAISLNFRDIAIVKDQYPFPTMDAVIPISDAAGEVVAIGSGVTRFRTGERVSPIFTQSHISDPMDAGGYHTTLGGPRHGVASEFISIDEQSLVLIPRNLDFVQAASLPCAAVTAWNALYGVGGKQLRPGQWVLTQGTGGVSLFTLQLAKAAGARVVSTTSSDCKADLLRELGADHIVNYRNDADWGSTARKLTNGKGFDHIIDVGGNATLRQSLTAIRVDGVISVVGFLGEDTNGPTMLEALSHTCIVRGIWIGSRNQFEEMVQCIEANSIVPKVDDKVFKFDELVDAYRYVQSGSHVGKVCITV